MAHTQNNTVREEREGEREEGGGGGIQTLKSESRKIAVQIE